ncbi:putative thiol-disulfide isomerase and thioredoxins family (plasmid) [Legionella adelaidensis]|uniref:Putative thiol-disulfide isomerase n=1 Tax=Legionella adelaidensis TaxID=45056 RepID=A0A0W0R1Z8_9GAMM|nr:thioredoxin family protein [Legionella adelaidensis]KTC65090.1 putative thiol-disulfide isomerase [Legionella adelaidensis]VEH85390.1 putative thiol-disulfide isomerase and thioredoxins family [Legionella adelaidensis]
MVKTASTMIDLGTNAPQFKLIDAVSGKQISYSDNKNAVATVIMFICNHCPYVKHINHELTRLANDYLAKGIQFFAINSNDATQYPEDSFENMKMNAKVQAYPFPYLYDETQEVAKAYQAACTPDFFIFNHLNELVYRGQLDDSRPGNGIPVTGSSIRDALNCLLSNKEITKDQSPSLGCNIKWKS